MTPPVWIYTFRAPAKIRLTRHRRVKVERHVLNGSTIHVRLGDSMLAHRVQGRRGGNPWVRFFRLRMIRNEPVVHFGPRWGERWHWLRTQGERFGFQRTKEDA